MLDAKILTAVLASLAALTAGAQGGNIDGAQINSQQLSSGGINMDFMNGDLLSTITGFLQSKPEPTNDVTAELVVDTLASETISSKEGKLSANNLTQFKMGSKRIVSDEKIYFYNYNGDIKPGKVTKFKGTAERFSTSDVNVTGFTVLEDQLETDFITVKGVNKISVSFSSVKGTIQSNSASNLKINSSKSFNINSFSGDVKIYPENSTVILDGRVDELSAGEFSFGG